MLAALTGDIEEAWVCLERPADQLASAEQVTELTTYLVAQCVVSLAAGDRPSGIPEGSRGSRCGPPSSTARALSRPGTAGLWLRDAEGVRAALTGRGPSPPTGGGGAAHAEAGLAALEGEQRSGRGVLGGHRGLAGARVHVRPRSVRAGPRHAAGPRPPECHRGQGGEGHSSTELGAKPSSSG